MDSLKYILGLFEDVSNVTNLTMQVLELVICEILKPKVM
jgi:hypothetical protein